MVVSIDKATALKMYDKVRAHWDAETARVRAELALYAPPGMPAPLVEQLNRDVTAALNVPESKRRLNELGLELVGGSPAELRAYTRAESVLLGKLMATAGIEKE